jgi:hypothetical protein
MPTKREYQVAEYVHRENPRQLAFVGIVAGMGKNRGTWDTSHGRSAAYKHCAQLRKENAGNNRRFFVETTN